MPKAIALINKSDLGSSVQPSDLPFTTIIPICAKTGEGLQQLADVVDEMFASDTPCDGSILTNARQYDAIRRAYEAMLRALQGLQLGLDIFCLGRLLLCAHKDVPSFSVSM